MVSEQSEKEPKKTRNSGFLILYPRFQIVLKKQKFSEYRIIVINILLLACGLSLFIQAHHCPNHLMLFSYSGNTPFVSARPSPVGPILASGPPVHTKAKPAVSIFEVLLIFHS